MRRQQKWCLRHIFDKRKTTPQRVIPKAISVFIGCSDYHSRQLSDVVRVTRQQSSHIGFSRWVWFSKYHEVSKYVALSCMWWTQVAERVSVHSAWLAAWWLYQTCNFAELHFNLSCNLHDCGRVQSSLSLISRSCACFLLSMSRHTTIITGGLRGGDQPIESWCVCWGGYLRYLCWLVRFRIKSWIFWHISTCDGALHIRPYQSN